MKSQRMAGPMPTVSIAGLAAAAVLWGGCEPRRAEDPIARAEGEGEAVEGGAAGDEGAPGNDPSGEGEEVEEPANACPDSRYRDANCAELILCTKSCAGEGCAEACLDCGVQLARDDLAGLGSCADAKCEGRADDSLCMCGSCPDELAACGLGSDCPIPPPPCGCSITEACLAAAGQDVRDINVCIADACADARIAVANSRACDARCHDIDDCPTPDCETELEACDTDAEGQELTCGGMFRCVDMYCVIPGGVDSACVIACNGWMSDPANAAMQPFLACAAAAGCTDLRDPAVVLRCFAKHCRDEYQACLGVELPVPSTDECSDLFTCWSGCAACGQRGECHVRSCDRDCNQDAADWAIDHLIDLLACSEAAGCEEFDADCAVGQCPDRAGICGIDGRLGLGGAGEGTDDEPRDEGGDEGADEGER